MRESVATFLLNTSLEGGVVKSVLHWATGTASPLDLYEIREGRSGEVP
jgi:hypothetical protein